MALHLLRFKLCRVSATLVRSVSRMRASYGGTFWTVTSAGLNEKQRRKLNRILFLLIDCCFLF